MPGEPGHPQFVPPGPTPVGGLLEGRPPTGTRAPPFLAAGAPAVDLGAAITQLQGSMNTLMSTLTPEQQARMLSRAEFREAVDGYEKTLNPYSKMWKGLGILAGVTAAVFGAGVTYQQYMGGNATKADIEEHVSEDLAPVQAEVKALKEEVIPIKEGVESLVETQEQEMEVKRLRRLVERHDRQYEQLLQEYTAAKAAGRRWDGPKPTKTPEHLRLEDQLEELEGKL